MSGQLIAPPFQLTSLEAHAVHVWRASLLNLSDQAAYLSTLLSVDEKARADRFIAEHARRQFIVGRSYLRLILSTYLNDCPGDFRFDYGRHGKPKLVPHRAIHFSVSHSADVVLIAVARARNVGVDVECVRDGIDHDEIAEQCFTVGELARFRRLPSDTRPREFFRYWTSKEAFTKAIGGGLAIPLDKIDVRLATAGQPSSVSWQNGARIRQWHSHELRLGDEYVGAFVARSKELDVRVLDAGIECRAGAHRLIMIPLRA